VADNFNADFYITCATVIPVLFIAVTLQGQVYEAVLREALKTRQMGAVAESRLLQQVAYFIWAPGAIGEVFAVLALYYGHNVGGSRLYVLLATLILVVAVAARPFVALTKVTDRVWDRRSLADEPGQAAGVVPGDERDDRDGDP
jgi:hypothetical protein